MISATEALDQLKAGNERYKAGTFQFPDHVNDEKRKEQAGGQQPWAIVLGCSDSRVPTEVVFDQGIGDIFTVRVAGNIASLTQIGSIEFAVASWGTPLVVVMGHTKCGAVNATIATIQDDSIEHSPSLDAIVSSIRPALEPLVEKNDTEHAVRANVDASVAQLLELSPLLSEKVAAKELTIVGAEYDLESGTVEFYQ